MKKIILNSSYFSLTVLLGVLLSSCLKDKGWENGEYGSINKNTEGGKYVSIRSSGTANFSKSSILINTTDPAVIKVPVEIDLDYMNPTSEPITVTLAIDNSKIAEYNTATGKSFVATTAAMAKLTQTTVTIPAGARTVSTTIEVAQSQFDPSKSYLIPVTITSATGGFQMSSNLNTKWFNIIGNPLAGQYSWTYRRYQQADTSGVANGGGTFYNQPVTIPPVNETTLLFPEAYTQTFVNTTGGILLSFTNNNGVLSNFTATLDPKSLADYPAGGFTLGSNAKIINATVVGNASTQYKGSTFSFYVQYINSTGGIRTLINTFTKL